MGAPDLPSGTVAFLFTDIEGSTQLLRALGDDYAGVLEDHHRLLSEAFAASSGRIVDSQGDSLFAVFPRVRDAAAAAARAQAELSGHEWPNGAEIRVRMGIHVAEPRLAGDRYVGLGVHRAARISGVAHGGQVLLSEIAASLLRENEQADVTIRDLGRYELKDFNGPERIAQLVIDGRPAEFPPLKARPAAEPPPWWRRTRRVAVAAVAAIGAVVVVATLLTRDKGLAIVPDSLVKIDVRTNEIVDVVELGNDPGEVEVVGGYVFVASRDEGTLFRLDRATGELETSGRFATSGSIEPESDGWLWVVSADRGEAARVEVESLSSSQSVPVFRASASDVEVGVGVGAEALWTLTYPSAIERRPLETLRVEASYPLADSDYTLEMESAHGGMWVTLGSPSNAVLRIDERTGRMRRVAVGGLPLGVAAGFGSIWVAMWEDDKVWRIDPATLRAREIVTVGEEPLDVAVGAGSVWVTNHCSRTVSRIDPGSDTVSKSIDVGYHPQWLAVGGGFAWVGISERGVPFETCLGD